MKSKIKNFFSSLFSHERRTVGLILLLCLVVRLGFFLAVQPWKPDVVENVILKDDARGYHELGVSLTANFQFNHGIWEKETVRTPLYPLVIAFFYYFFGVYPWIILFFQIILDVGTCFILYFALKKGLSKRSALWGILFYSIDPFLALFSTKLLTETLFIFCMVTFFYFFISTFEDSAFQKVLFHIILSGIFLGLSALIKPIVLYLPLLFLSILLIINFHSCSLKTTVIKIIGFLLSYFLTLSPWLIRNKTTFDVFALSSSSSYNLLALYTAPMMAEKWNMPVKKTITRLFNETDSIIIKQGFQPNKMNGFQKSVYWKKLALKYILKDPTEFVKSYVQGLFNCFFVLGVEAFSEAFHLGTPVRVKQVRDGFSLKQKFLNKTKEEIAIGIILALFQAVTYLFMFLGMFTMRRDKFFIFLLLVSGYFILLPGPSNYLRFRLPAIPFYLGFVGVGCRKARYFSAQIKREFFNPHATLDLSK